MTASGSTPLEKIQHSNAFRFRRVLNWFPMGLTYAFLYMARYNLTVSEVALGELMTKADFGNIFSTGAIIYAFSFLINGPLTDKIGGKRAILIGAIGAALMNIGMGVLTYILLTTDITINLVLWFSLLYAANMYFQSYGAVAIVKVNSSWFHIRERGIFGGIFGILISLGIYFAFDWGYAIVDATAATAKDLNIIQQQLRSILGIDAATGVDQTWWLFFIPATILIVFAIIEIFLLRDRPSGAGFEDFDTADASSGEEDKPFNLMEILKKILTNKIILTIAIIEFCSGVMRNGIMHWYFIFTSDMGYVRNFFVHANWGLLLMLAGSFGGMAAGVVSDKIFGSRRGPVAALLYGAMLLSTIVMLPLVTNTNNDVKQGFKVVIDHTLLQNHRKSDEINLELIKSKLQQTYEINDEETDSTNTSFMVFSPNKKDMLASKISDTILLEYEFYNDKKGKWETGRARIKDICDVLGSPSDSRAYFLGFIVVFMSLCVIGVHGMLSGTATMDFGGRRAAATAVGLIDGFVYLGTGVQSFALGKLTTQSWNYWAPFLIPFSVIGLILAIRIWHAFPHAKRKGR
jgi:OPA family glycerol-3-phosphate transporter-like MFS transporter